MAKRTIKVPIAGSSTESARDAYGFPIRPQHLKLYKQYAGIYKEEETERSARWEHFLAAYSRSVSSNLQIEPAQSVENLSDEATTDRAEKAKEGSPNFERWETVDYCLWPVQRALSHRFAKRKKHAQTNNHSGAAIATNLNSETEPYRAASPTGFTSGASEDESDEEFYDVERSDVALDGVSGSSEPLNEAVELEEEPCTWKEELDALIRGGVPMALRGEVWQLFVGSSEYKLQGHYEGLLSLPADSDAFTSPPMKSTESGATENWSSQIEKDLSRTFPGHPALEEDGRNALRRLLRSYAQHNSDVGYCQAMNFFAALLLLMMPEENAFWTLACIIDDYFKGYYSEKMLESQVDQLVLEDLVRSHFPRLVTHLDNLGLQVSWVTGPWFLSIFVNILPWESVLRVWDVLLYEGNRVMLFRTTLALLELHGSAIMAAKDAGDAVALLQSRAGATFDSSQLVLTACMGYQSVNEPKLRDLRSKYYPQVLATFTEDSDDKLIWQQPSGSNLIGVGMFEKSRSSGTDQQSEKDDGLGGNSVPFFSSSGENGTCTTVKEDPQVGDGISAKGLLGQVKLLKVELSRALEQRRAAMLREEELEAAFMELVKEDNRRLLSAKVESLEDEISQLKQALVDKEQQEHSMVQVVMRMEHEQRLTEDARRTAENDAAAQRAAVKALQAKYDGALASLKEMEKRALMAESMLEATLQSQNLGNGHIASPRPCSSAHEEESSRWSWPWNTPKLLEPGSSLTEAVSKQGDEELPKDMVKVKDTESKGSDPPQKQGVLAQRFSLAWRERTKGKVSAAGVQKFPSSEEASPLSPQSSLDASLPSPSGKMSDVRINTP